MQVIGDRDEAAGNSVVVLIPNITPLTDMAVALACLHARPGKDTIHLVTVVNNDLSVRAGDKLLEHYRYSVENDLSVRAGDIVLEYYRYRLPINHVHQYVTAIVIIYHD